MFRSKSTTDNNKTGNKEHTRCRKPKIKQNKRKASAAAKSRPSKGQSTTRAMLSLKATTEGRGNQTPVHWFTTIGALINLTMVVINFLGR